MSNFTPGDRVPPWFKHLPFWKPAGRVYTTGHAKADALVVFRYERQGDVADWLNECYLSGENKEDIWIQLYCPLCFKGNSVAQPELSLKNNGPNPKKITLGREVRVKIDRAGLPEEIVNAFLFSVETPIGCAQCGTWKVIIKDGIAKDIGAVRSFEPLNG